MATKIKKLYRSKKDRLILGVCGGLGSYFQIDSNIFRIIFIVLALLQGIGILLYIALVLFVPSEDGRGIEEDRFKEVSEFKKRAEEKVQDIAKEIKKK